MKQNRLIKLDKGRFKSHLYLFKQLPTKSLPQESSLNISVRQAVIRFAAMASQFTVAAAVLSCLLALATFASCNTEGKLHIKILIVLQASLVFFS
jgi:hypothetical protein